MCISTTEIIDTWRNIAYNCGYIGQLIEGYIMATVDIRLRVSKEMKSDAETIFEQMGITISEAMRIFLSQCINTGGLPFKPHSKIYNKETLESFQQIESGEYETYTLEEFEETINKLNNK